MKNQVKSIALLNGEKSIVNIYTHGAVSKITLKDLARPIVNIRQTYPF